MSVELRVVDDMITYIYPPSERDTLSSNQVSGWKNIVVLPNNTIAPMYLRGMKYHTDGQFWWYA